ncbi:MAG TPA: FHA domain-containing protein [Candidatus Thermoplasmatota archaeon]|nr:FHA domain-containing protein [Candidatus Thermoplasmatota archaeon]
MVPREETESERLLVRLRALASPVRLQILRALVVPTRAGDLRVRAARERAGLDAGRTVGRPTVIEHLDVLEGAGLVRRVGDAYAVDQQGVVALLQDLGELARLRALIEVDVEATRIAPPPAIQPLPVWPRALIANGPSAGRAIALDGAGPWRLGRGAECEVSLGHDPHVSREHATLEREGTGFVVRVSPQAKNPLFVDFVPVEPGARAAARGGSLLLVGATLVVLQL